MRSAERNFKIASISEANLTSKKIFKSKKIGKPKLGEYIESRTVTKPSSIDNYNYTTHAIKKQSNKTTYQATQTGSIFSSLWDLIVTLFWIFLIGAWLLSLFS